MHDHLHIDVGEQKLLIGRVDDGGMVRAGKHIGGSRRPEMSQNYRLGS